MNLWTMVMKEMWHRRGQAALMVLAVAVAAGSLVGSLSVLKAHDLSSQRILRAKQEQTRAEMAKLEDTMRKAMLGLGFNIVILPKEANLEEWHAQNFGSATMPEEYATRLAKAKVITVQHLLPCLQEKLRWEEAKRSVILVGTRGEEAGGKKPMMEAVAAGTMVVGFELAEGMGLKVGEKTKLNGREMTVAKIFPMRGSADDITVWVSLKEAQEMLGKPGRINAIQALECECAFADLAKVRGEITKILPDTQVIERGSQALARAEARTKVAEEAAAALMREEKNLAAMQAEREKLAGVLVPVVMVGAAVWMGALALMNVRARRGEIGILRAIGVKAWRVFGMVLAKAVIVGAIGGLIGCAVGCAVGRGGFEMGFAVMAMTAAVVLSGLASWVPALLASRADPATVLRGE